MDFILKTIHFIKYFKVHLRIKNRDFYPLDFDTGKKIEEVQILGLQSSSPKNYYSHLFNKRGGWNKRGGGAKVANSLNVKGGIFWKKLVHNSNKQGVEGGKDLRNQ